MTETQRLEAQTTKDQTVWKSDPAHSGVAFSVKHLMFATVRGRFREFNATLHLDATDPARSRLEAEIEAASIDTGTDDRDTHLRSADFLDAAEHSRLVFRSTHIEMRGADKARVTGGLTIRGVTKEITLDVTRDGQGVDPWGNDRAAYTASATIDRRDWGLTWNQVLEAGGFLVGDKVKIEIEAQLVAANPAGA